MKLKPYPVYKGSGHEWLGHVPIHWDIERFRYCFEESPEKIGNEIIGQMLSVSGYRGIEIKEYEDENQKRTDQDLIGYRIVRPGQLVVNTMWLNYAGLGVSEHEGYVSPAYRSYWINDDLNKRFIHHLMRSGVYVIGYTKFLTGIRPNSLQMSRDDLMVFPVLIPTLSEQEIIATFLDRETAKLDTLIAKQEKLIELLQEKRQAVISHAVTKGLDPDVPMKDSGVEWLGDVPAHWDLPKLKYMAAFSGGGTPSRDNAAYWNGDIPWLSPKDMKTKYIIEAEESITTEGLVGSTSNMLDPGHVLMVVRSGILKHTIPVGINEVPLAINQDIKAIKLSEDRCFNQFFMYWVQGLNDLLLLAWAKQGATVESIEHAYLANSVIPLPAQNEQTEIVAHLDQEISKINLLIEKAQRSIELAKEHRTALISAAVTGKVDVRNVA